MALYRYFRPADDVIDSYREQLLQVSSLKSTKKLSVAGAQKIKLFTNTSFPYVTINVIPSHTRVGRKLLHDEHEARSRWLALELLDRSLPIKQVGGVVKL